MREPEDPIMLHMLHYILANEGGRCRVDRGSIILDAAREFPDVTIGLLNSALDRLYADGYVERRYDGMYEVPEVVQ